MIQFPKLLKDILCVVGIILLLKYTYDLCKHIYYPPKPAPVKVVTVPTPPPSAAKLAWTLTKKGSNALVKLVSGTLITIGNITKKAQFEEEKGA